MSALRNFAQGCRKVWGMGDEDDYEDDAPESQPQSRSQATEEDENDAYERVETRTESRTVYAPNSALRGRRAPGDDDENPPRHSAPQHGQSQPAGGGRSGNGAGGARNLRSVSMPLRAREKNIYTLKPKTMSEASLAADYLKTGCAVVVNLEDVERTIAVRIIDFMSGVCYGLEHQGHAMKLGEIIFLFTPGDFEISSDEVDYAENTDFIFKEMSHSRSDSGASLSEGASERRSWER